MDQNRTWWDPLAGALAGLDIAPVALDMPSLETEGPEAWEREIVRHLRGQPAILIGHSLGAAACLRAARDAAVDGVFLLACPLFSGHFYPPPPPAQLSTRAVARVTRFLKAASDQAAAFSGTPLIVGDRDPFVPLDQARRFPFRTVVVPNAGHEINRAPSLIPILLEQIAVSPAGRRHLDPGARARVLAPGTAPLPARLELTAEAPPPARLDIEITTRCQLACPLCARTLCRDPGQDQDMPLPLFERVLGEMEFCGDVFFVGLGEPLLHPLFPAFVERAARAGLSPRLVTNGLLATPDTLARLRDAGLAEVTFSIDTTDPVRFRQLRGGADPDVVLGNFRAVPGGLAKSIFATLSTENLSDLPGLVDLAAENGLRAIGVTDVNFEPNQALSLSSVRTTQRSSLQEDKQLSSVYSGGLGSVPTGVRDPETPILPQAGPDIAAAIQHARDRHVLLISPHFHDFDNNLDSLRRCRVKKADDLTCRARQHTHCLAPWRIAVVGVNGMVTPCNCAPTASLGNLAAQPLGEVWNGPALCAWREAVLHATSTVCLTCPRY
jgi:MoaA/NifB/PqqE/SkfB family radical SAM enzyme/predicted alpha/beta hydrolase family esterase